jgi:hypothetical protein
VQTEDVRLPREEQGPLAFRELSIGEMAIA